MFCVIPPSLSVAIFSSFMVSYPVYVNMCSVELPGGGVHAMNNVVLTKWRIALSITSECLRITEEWFECYDHDSE